MQRRFITIAAILAVIVTALAVWWLFFSGEPVWQPTTQVYAPERCAEEKCEPVLDIPLVESKPLGLFYDPGVDDAVAQWSDCLEEVVACVEKGKGAAGAYPRCVKQSTCPPPCRKAFARRAAGITQTKQMIAALEAVFLAPDALCHPGAEGGHISGGGR
jgi:hypothetical protein